MVLIGIAAAGVLLPFARGDAVQAEGVHRTLAAVLANSLMEQIVATPFASLVTNYNYTEAQGQLRDTSGVVMTDQLYADFSREVTCQYVHVPQQDNDAPASFALATVRVRYRGQALVTVNRLISQ